MIFHSHLQLAPFYPPFMHAGPDPFQLAMQGSTDELFSYFAKRSPMINAKNRNGSSCLHIAAWSGNCPMVSVFNLAD